MKLKVMIPLVPRILRAFACAATVAGVLNSVVAAPNIEDGVIAAERLAAEFKTDPKAAETAWRDKALVIRGTVQRLVAGDVSSKAGAVFFKTGDGMPAVKVDFADTSDPSATHEFRVTDGKTLEVRTKKRDAMQSFFPNMPRGFGPKQHVATWSVLLSVGETATFSGQCRGRQLYITVANGELLKKGWKGGGAAVLAGNGGGPAGGP